MLTKLQLKGFRGFPSLRVSDLGRVTLFVGKNNSGKTALLEAVEALSGAFDPTSVLRGPRRRAELSVGDNENAGQDWVVSHLFYGHLLEVGSRFEITGENSRPSKLSCEVVIRKSFRDEEETQQPLFNESSHDLPLGLSIKTDDLDKAIVLPVLSTGAISRRMFLPELSARRIEEKTPVTFVAADSLDGTTLQRLWESVELTPEEDRVIAALRILEPSIDRIAGSTSETRRVGTPMFRAKINPSGQVIPLGTMGGGLKRMLGLALALSRSPRGVLLVDEIDTGLHHSTMRDMWKMVIATATRLDIQVFATTHSSDCWRSLGYLCASDPEIAQQVSVHRLERGLDHTIQYTPEELAVAAQQDIDIR